MIEILRINEIHPTAEEMIRYAGGAIRKDEDGYKVTIPKILSRRDLFGDGRLSERPQSDPSPLGFPWQPLYQLPSEQWLKVEVYDDRQDGKDKRRIVLCGLETEIAAWIKRRENLRANGGYPRPDWTVGLAPPPWGGVFTPGIDPETTRHSVAPTP